MWFLRVASCLTEVFQQIHSLRARGVRLSHFEVAAELESRAFLRSAGISCTVPPEIFVEVIRSIYLEFWCRAMVILSVVFRFRSRDTCYFMSMKRKWDIGSLEVRKKCIDEITTRIHEQKGEEISFISGGDIIDIVVQNLGPDIYNMALADAKKLVENKVSDLTIELDLLKQEG